MTHRLRDSKETLRKLNSWSKMLGKVSDDIYLLSFDINKFYPTVDQTDFDQIVEKRLKERPDIVNQKLIEPIMEAIRLCGKTV